MDSKVCYVNFEEPDFLLLGKKFGCILRTYCCVRSWVLSVFYAKYFVCAYCCNSEVIFHWCHQFDDTSLNDVGAKVEHTVQKTWLKWWSEHEVINIHYWDIPVNQSRLKGNTFCCQKVFKTKGNAYYFWHIDDEGSSYLPKKQYRLKFVD